MIKFNLIYFIALLFLFQCANIKTISGGEKDSTPPKINSAKSSPANLINYDFRPIIIAFDEWVAIDNPINNIIVSPTIKYPLKIKQKGKSIIINFDKKEDLLPNTTYTINFGESIKDITENNIAHNLKYVFSTGEIIDSFKLEGRVSLAENNSIPEKAIVLLYDNLNDTAFEKTKPRYFTWTNKEGKYLFENLHSGNYAAYALIDKNQNYYYDQNTESFARLDTIIMIPEFQILPELRLSATKPPIAIKDKILQNGKLKLIYNRKTYNSHVECDSKLTDIHLYSDSLVIYSSNNDTVRCICKNEKLSENFIIPPFKNNAKDVLKSIKLFQEPSFSGSPQKLIFKANKPLKNFNSNSFVLQGKVPNQIFIDPEDKYNLMVDHSLLEEGTYWLHIDSSSCVDIYDHMTFPDSLLIQIKPNSLYSRLEIVLDSVDINRQYIIEFYKNNNLVYRSLDIANDIQIIKNFPFVDPQPYNLKIIEDKNNNNEWDPGDYTSKTQPEKIWIFDIKDLRADWDIKKILKLNK